MVNSRTIVTSSRSLSPKHQHLNLELKTKNLNPFFATTMDSFHNLVARGSALLARDDSPQMSSTVVDLLIALLVLVFILLCLTFAIFTLRKIRQRKAIARQQLPLYSEKRLSTASSVRSHHRRLTISTSPGNGSSIYLYDEKKSPDSPTTPTSPVPEIRITFPDEQDESGRRKSGRVVVVRVGETGVGLEPLHDAEEQLPAYEKESKGRFQSIDIERIGGLKEKSSWA